VIDERTHGVRRTYQAGCRCKACAAAEAGYRAELRRLARTGRPPLGALVRAGDAARIVRALLVERFTRRRVADEAGLERHTVRLSPSSRVRLSTILRLRRTARRLLGEL